MNDSMITSDETVMTINAAILKLEKELIPLLSDEALGKFLELDSLQLQLFAHLSDKVHR